MDDAALVYSILIILGCFSRDSRQFLAHPMLPLQDTIQVLGDHFPFSEFVWEIDRMY